MLKNLFLSFLLILSSFYISPAYAGSFVHGHRITHSQGYDGKGGEQIVKVCIDKDAPQAKQMEAPVKRALATWNALVPATKNVVKSGNSKTHPNPRQLDAESVVLHELGHCAMGLKHIDDPEKPSASTWFVKKTNDPCSAQMGTVDASTMSTQPKDLPRGNSSIHGATRQFCARLGYPNTESIMKTGGNTPGVTRRKLGGDDVRMAKLAMSGLDEKQGTSDDYTVRLVYGGIHAPDHSSCDITIGFKKNMKGKGVCNSTSTSIGSGHGTLKKGRIYLKETPRWFYGN